jgi:hypothetical protein
MSVTKANRVLKRTNNMRTTKSPNEVCISGVWAETSPMTVCNFFSRGGFHPEGATVEIRHVPVLIRSRTTVVLPRSEVARATDWANGRTWRGRALRVVTQRGGEW